MRGFAVWLVVGMVAPVAAHAVVVRGKVTSPLGVPLAGARVQLIQGKRSVADTISGYDGTYEIRTSFAGRFVLLTAPSAVVHGYAPQIGAPFYGSRSSLVTIDIVLNRAGIVPQVSSEETLTPLALKRLAGRVEQARADELLGLATPVAALQTLERALVVQAGGMGAPAALSLRGAPPATVRVSVDGVTANPLGEGFNFAGIAATGLAAVDARPALEGESGANPLHGVGAAGGDVALHGIEPGSEGRWLTYTGDAGTLGAVRNEVEAGYAKGRFDGMGAFSRFDEAGASPVEPFHLTAWAGSLAYHVSAGTALGARARYDEPVSGLASPFNFYGVSPEGKVAAQNLLGSAWFDTRTAGGWHNAVRYGMARERWQTYDFATPATGLPVTIHGANGYTASGTALFEALPVRQDNVTDRDVASYETDYRVRPWLSVVGEARVEDERAADVLPGLKRTLDRMHVEASVGFEGDIRHRVFYEASGFVDHAQGPGWVGAPRFGLTYAPVRPGAKAFRGTSLHATAAAGVRESSLLEAAAGTASPSSRTMDVAVEQNVWGEKLTLRAGYVHSQFSHEFEPVGLGTVASEPVLSQTLALRTQGAEFRMRYLPWQRLELEGGYGYLAALTERSAQPASFNPGILGIAIGGLSALEGQRPFQRPPQSGFLRAEWSGTRVNAGIDGKLVSRSDGSTRLVETPGLLLPNRNLSPGWADLDAHVSVAVTHGVTVFTEMTNLLEERDVAPIGYRSEPFTIRTGLRIRFGGE
jgi:iron complex outermembrane receptor protein/vitamin B12 transporter